LPISAGKEEGGRNLNILSLTEGKKGGRKKRHLSPLVAHAPRGEKGEKSRIFQALVQVKQEKEKKKKRGKKGKRAFCSP